MITEINKGTGAVHKKKDLRDRKWSKLAMAPRPFDWNEGYDVELVIKTITGNTSPTKDQGTSDSCGGQSGSYYMAGLAALNKGTFEEKSARFVYSQIFYPQGGTTLRDVLNFLANKGDSSEVSVVSYHNGQPPTESFMRDRTGVDGATANALASKGTGYAFVNPDIESYAQAIRDNHGAIMELAGENNGTWLSAFPKPPSNIKGHDKWRHFIFAGKAKLIDGKKYIGVHNSWGNDTGEQGWQWIGEDYFASGNILEGGVVYDQAQVLVQKIDLTSRLLAILQAILNKLTGPTKKPI